MGALGTQGPRGAGGGPKSRRQCSHINMKTTSEWKQRLPRSSCFPYRCLMEGVESFLKPTSVILRRSTLRLSRCASSRFLLMFLSLNRTYYKPEINIQQVCSESRSAIRVFANPNLIFRNVPLTIFCSRWNSYDKLSISYFHNFHTFHDFHVPFQFF